MYELIPFDERLIYERIETSPPIASSSPASARRRRGHLASPRRLLPPARQAKATAPAGGEVTEPNPSPSLYQPVPGAGAGPLPFPPPRPSLLPGPEERNR